MSTIAYLRRSRVERDSPGAISHETQLSAILELARRHGAEPTVLEDWGRSGGAGKEHLRPSYRALRDAVASGTITDVFAYDLSRLTRSLEEWARLAALCSKHRVRVHLVQEGTFDFTTASGEMVANILASVAQAVRRWAQERALASAAIRRKRGDKMGRTFYLDQYPDALPTLMAAFTEAGSVNGACRLLNERGVPSWSGGPWAHRSLHDILRREAPELFPPGVRKGAPTVGRHRLAGLLVCHCGRRMTTLNRKSGTAYQCHAAARDPSHPRPYYVAEAMLMPWIMAEAARLTVPAEIEETVAANGHSLERLAERRRRLALTFADGALDEPTSREQLTALDAEAAKAEAVTHVMDVPQAIPWDAPPEAVNRLLRKLWYRVELGPDLRPIRAEWRLPRFRRAD